LKFGATVDPKTVKIKLNREENIDGKSMILLQILEDLLI
jgi:hypothetical protein